MYVFLVPSPSYPQDFTSVEYYVAGYVISCMPIFLDHEPFFIKLIYTSVRSVCWTM